MTSSIWEWYRNREKNVKERSLNMKGKWKRMFCGVLAAVMLTAAPVAAHADTVIIAGIETEVVQTLPGKATNSKINTKSKTVTLYAGLTYTFKGNGFKRAKANWKISNTKYATLKVGKTGAATLKTKKAGKFTITASQGNKKYTYKVTVKEDFKKRFLETEAKNNVITWDALPGADGYLVCRQYFSECGYNEFGWKDGEQIVLADIKAGESLSYDISNVENWDFYWRNNWFLRVKPYQIVGDEVVFASEYAEDMTFNTVKLK